MAIFRLEPGEVAPWPGFYSLVGHYGEGTNFSVWRDRGQRLPTFTGDPEHGPFWFVLVYEANEQSGVL
jgi:hypothetical protein